MRCRTAAAAESPGCGDGRRRRGRRRSARRALCRSCASVLTGAGGIAPGSGIAWRSDSSSCVIVPSRTLVSSTFSRTTRMSPDMLSIWTLPSANAFRSSDGLIVDARVDGLQRLAEVGHQRLQLLRLLLQHAQVRHRSADARDRRRAGVRGREPHVRECQHQRAAARVVVIRIVMASCLLLRGDHKMRAAVAAPRSFLVRGIERKFAAVAHRAQPVRVEPERDEIGPRRNGAPLAKRQIVLCRCRARRSDLQSSRPTSGIFSAPRRWPAAIVRLASLTSELS